MAMDEIPDLVRRVAPPVDVDGVDELVARMASEVVGQRVGRRAARRRISRKALGAITVAVVVVPGVAAAAIRYGAETGTFGRPGFTENDTSQYIDMCAPDLGAYVRSLAPRAEPLPPGVTWDQVADRYSATFARYCPPRGPGEVTQVTGIRSSLLGFATCPWERWAITAPPDAAAADVGRADRALAQYGAAQHEANPHGTAGWQIYAHRYATASEQYLDYDYQVNCLGRDTTANPPTVSDPDA